MNDPWEVPAALIGGPFAITVWAIAEVARRWIVRRIDEGREKAKWLKHNRAD